MNKNAQIWVETVIYTLIGLVILGVGGWGLVERKVIRLRMGLVIIVIVVGGFMVDEACRLLPQGRIFDALCETPKCLPDALQVG